MEYILLNDKAVATVRWGCGCCKDEGPLEPVELARLRLFANAADMHGTLKLALEYWNNRLRRYKNKRPVWVSRAQQVLAKVSDQPATTGWKAP